MMMMMSLAAVCCCCFLSCGGILALYFMHDGFKEWIDDNLLNKGDDDDTPCEYEYVRRFCPLTGGCKDPDWKCPEGYEDTGLGWSDGAVEGEKQCKKCKV